MQKFHSFLGASPALWPLENRDNGLLIFYSINEFTGIAAYCKVVQRYTTIPNESSSLDV